MRLPLPFFLVPLISTFVLSQTTDIAPDPTREGVASPLMGTATFTPSPSPSNSYAAGYGGTAAFSIDITASVISGWGVGSNPACYALCLAQVGVPNGCSVTDTHCQCFGEQLIQAWIGCLQGMCPPSDFSSAKGMLFFTCPDIPPAWVPALTSNTPASTTTDAATPSVYILSANGSVSSTIAPATATAPLDSTVSAQTDGTISLQVSTYTVCVIFACLGASFLLS
ncbi:hypothetical protein OF83DRAFT_1281993 [Amylostereum chailletii]|nr:hypothetical protein OF83DRAFT_1281993 [Amylostereum chailletii]